MITLIFISSILLTLYAYFGYPVSLMVIKLIRPKVVKKDVIPFNVTLIITVHNEKNRIEEKLINTLSIEYPRDKIEIIVASDGSTDGTNDIVMNYKKYGIELLAIPNRRGKEYAQKEAVKIANGEILVFSDVATKLSLESLVKIVSNFADNNVGAVSGEDRLIRKENVASGESLYLRYEMWLRRLESGVNSLVGMSGSFFAVRKEVCKDFSEDMQSDFRTVLNCIKMNLRAVTDSQSIGYYEDVSGKMHEFERKVRTVLRGLTVFFNNREFLNIVKYGLFSYQYFCHKLLRWLVPLFLLVAFLSNLILSVNSIIYLILLMCQLIFYSIGTIGFLKNKRGISIIEKVPTYFITVNLAITIAWYKYLVGERIVIWTPSRR